MENMFLTKLLLFLFVMPVFGRDLAKVEFQVQAEVPHGVTLRLSGSIPQLGYFSPASSIPMHTTPKEYRATIFSYK